MQISIAERLKPFNHQPGTTCPLPGSSFAVQVFPTLICLYDLTSQEPKLLSKITTDIKGPVKDFTVQLDLEKGNVVVFGMSATGYFRYRLHATSDGKNLKVIIERAPTQEIHFKTDFALASENDELYKPLGQTRLSLGNHKAQDWTLVKRREDLKEILPVWLRLGESIPLTGSISLLKNCEEALLKADVNHLLEPFTILFKAGFKSLMTPRLFDDDYQGIDLPVVDSTSKPLALLSHGAKLITSLFASFDSQTLKVLTHLPVEFHSGRFLHFRCENVGLLDFEWSKKTIRRMILFAESDAQIELKFQKEIKSFRLKSSSDSKAKNCTPSDVLKIEKGKTYFFDCFKK